MIGQQWSENILSLYIFSRMLDSETNGFFSFTCQCQIRCPFSVVVRKRLTYILPLLKTSLLFFVPTSKISTKYVQGHSVKKAINSFHKYTARVKKIKAFRRWLDEEHPAFASLFPPPPSSGTLEKKRRRNLLLLIVTMRRSFNA